MFTLLDHVLLRSMPFAHAEQLVSLAGLDSAHNHVQTVSSADWQDWRRGDTPALSGVALSSIPWRLALASGDSATSGHRHSRLGKFLFGVASAFRRRTELH